MGYWPTPSKCADPGEEHLQRKRFRQVVVGSKIQAFNKIFRGISCGEHKNRCLVMLCPQTSRNGEAVHTGQHHVQNDEVEFPALSHLEALAAIQSNCNGMAFFGQTLAEQFSHPGFIFNHENPHKDYPKSEI